MKKILLLLIACSFTLYIKSQDFLGYVNSNYAGVTGTDLQPAAVVDSRYKLDIALLGLSVNAYNNFTGIPKKAFEHTGGLFSGDYPAFQDKEFSKKYLSFRTNNQAKSLYAGAQFYLPSFMASINSKNAFALKWKIRTLLTIDGVSNDLAMLLTQDFNYPNLFNLQLNNQNLSVQTMSWAEYGLTYGRVLKEEGEHFFKAGATIKLIQGLQAAYLKIKELNYSFTTDSLASIFQTNVNYGHSTNFSINSNNINYKYASNPSLGFDLGVVYEWRPDYEKYKYEMDGEKNLYRTDKNKYKLKAGVSILDIGRIKFKRSPDSRDFIANVNFWDISKVNIKTIDDLDDTIKKRFVTLPSSETFKVNLPTAISTSVDYAIYNGFYINLTSYYSFQFRNKKIGIHDISCFSLAPRWEHKWFGASIPVLYDGMRNTKLGLSLRLGPLIIGSNSILPLISKKPAYGADLYLMLKIPVFYKHPNDRDGDNVSDKKDKCIDVAGVWEFAGCPDKDGDHIQDKDDECPDEPGTVALKGCPDRDADGIADKEDACPDEPGTIELKGCPDRDADGIADKEDACPDEPGAIELKGCPDRDADGIADKDDECPDIPGIIELKGCPETKLSLIDLQGIRLQTVTMDKNNSFTFDKLPPDEVVIFKLESNDADSINELKIMVNGIPKKAIRNEKDRYFRFIVLTTDKNKLDQEDAEDVAIRLNAQEKALMKKAFENLEFENGKDIITQHSYESLDALAGLMLKKPDWRLKIAGHTDNTGSAASNLKLSKNRAEAVKTYLVAKGINAERFKIMYFGSKKPIADNKTEAGRQKNRRVELLLIE